MYFIYFIYLLFTNLFVSINNYFTYYSFISCVLLKHIVVSIPLDKPLWIISIKRIKNNQEYARVQSGATPWDGCLTSTHRVGLLC